MKKILLMLLLASCAAPEPAIMPSDIPRQSVQPVRTSFIEKDIDPKDILNHFSSEGKVVGHHLPFPDELLEKEIKLTRECRDIVIREWWGTPTTTSAIKIIDDTCNRTVKAFCAFVIGQGFEVDRFFKMPISVSLLPWDARSGYEYRALNDMRWRFAKQNQIPPIYALADRVSNWIFIMNDVEKADPDRSSFDCVWSHELFHMYSLRSGVFSQHDASTRAERIIEEEKLAHRFTDYLGCVWK